MVDHASSDDGHPAPARRNASVASLYFGLGAGPLAWVTQSVFGYVLSSNACFPETTPRETWLQADTRPILFALNIGAIVIAVAGAMIASKNWSATREERGGGSDHLVEVGEGRTRFLAMCGILTSAGFLIATIFTLSAILLVPLCR